MPVKTKEANNKLTPIEFDLNTLNGDKFFQTKSKIDEIKTLYHLSQESAVRPMIAPKDQNCYFLYFSIDLCNSNSINAQINSQRCITPTDIILKNDDFRKINKPSNSPKITNTAEIKNIGMDVEISNTMMC